MVWAAALIINLDNTILNVALRAFVRDLHATSSQLEWIVDSYAMLFAGLLLVGASLADRFGRRTLSRHNDSREIDVDVAIVAEVQKS